MADPVTQSATQESVPPEPVAAEPVAAPAADTAAAPSPEPDLTGQTFGDFRIMRRLGQGGMGQVYLAEQISLKRHVALKFLKADLAANEVSLRRFKQEAESVARVTHANIVQIYAIAETAGQHYMALEYVEGKNLREFLEKRGTPDVLLGLRIMTQVAAALQRANEHGIVHRDIKPENILLTRTFEVKVADFGLSRCFGEQQAVHLTQSNVTMGTPLYMSPEQVEGKRTIDHRSDIYSFGVTCYHMFAGHPPFRGTSPFEVAVQHVQKEPEPLAEIRPDLPADLCTIIHKMMAKQPEARYQTAREILRDVSRLRDAVVVAGTTALAPTLSGVGEAAAAAPSTTLIRTAPVSTSRKVFLIGMVLVALGVGMAFGYLRNHPGPPPEAPPNGENPAPETLAPGKAVFSIADEEKRLLKNWQESVAPDPGLDAIAGMRHAIDLGLFYLKHKRLDDADKFFQELEKNPKGLTSYKFLGRLGKAITLAFRDDAKSSNELFVRLVDGKPGKIGGALSWKSDKGLREMIAKALYRNYVNGPETFPPQLEAYRHPPRPAPRRE
ncbi:MAG: serine/threonine protein kinase [Gemmataceae bacterium]|nr:serine/threonine protein kinase [Gemmataceae bacterium]